ncbi:MAG: TonB family protein [Bacteroidota bacterium]
MNRYIILFLFVIAYSANAQVRLKLNYNKHWELTTPDSAVYIRVCIYDTTAGFFAGPLSDLYLTGKPQMTGMYKYNRKAGAFITYYSNGQIESQGVYENDMRAGVWRRYYPDGKLKSEIEYFSNGAPEKVMTVNDADGNTILQNGKGKWIDFLEYPDGSTVTITGQYKNYLKDGHWTHVRTGKGENVDEWYRDGELLRARTKKDGRQTYMIALEDLQYSTPTLQKFVRTENFVATKSVPLETYPALSYITVNGRPRKKGDKITPADTTKVYMDVEEQPEVVGGLSAMMNFLARNIKYPSMARRTGVQGAVYVEFIVETDGTLTDIHVMKGIGGGCDEEAVRVIELMNEQLQWTPGKYKGTPVRVRFVLPVKFMLG